VVVEARKEPTNKQKNDLKAYVKTLVRAAGGKFDFAEACKLCHEEFPGVFTWGELEGLLKDVQNDWSEKRAVKELAKLEKLVVKE
jgi:hypothetical protein